MKTGKILICILVAIVFVSSLILLASAGGLSLAPFSLLASHAFSGRGAQGTDGPSLMALNGDVGGTGRQTTGVVPLAGSDLGCCDVGDWTDIVQVEAGYRHTVGLKKDGTVVAVRDHYDKDYGECDVGGWTNIVQVSAGAYHTVGLRADGTVVAVGRNESGECDVGGWTGIIQVSAGGALAGGHTVGLKADGTVVAVGWNSFYQCEVDDWSDIVQVSAGRHFTVGLRADGTAVAIGRNLYGQCDVGNWTDIVQVSAGAWHTLGRKPDGTVIAVGCTGWNERWGQCEVCDWTNIVQVSAGGYHTVGLRSDGTVLAVGANQPQDFGQCRVSSWTGIVQVDAGKWHTVGLKSDGTVLAVGGKKDPAESCFIATAAYGTPMAAQIQILRQFRDTFLLTNSVGRAMVDVYYSVSPPIAEFITEHPSLKPVVRAVLTPAVVVSALALNMSLAVKAAVVAFGILIAVRLSICRARRQAGRSAHV